MASPPADVVLIGSAFNTLGFEGNLTVAGLGLNTKGFLWPCSGIWSPSDDSGLVTVWVAMTSPGDTVETCQDLDGGGASPDRDLTTESDQDLTTEDGEKIST